MTNGLKAEVEAFLAGQKALGVKRNEIARSLFAKKYSEKQVATVLGVHPKTAHAMKEDNVEGKRQGRREIKNYIKGSAIEANKFFSSVKALVGTATHTKEAETERKRAKRAKLEAQKTA